LIKIDQLKTKQSSYLIITFVIFLLVFLPRFNGNQLIVKQQPYDTKYFKAYVNFFRGEIPVNEIKPATNWRFLVPLIASVLPLYSLTAINLINAILLVISLYVFFKVLHFFNVKPEKIWQSLWLFILSFPMFYYSSIGYVDASLFLFIALSIYATIKNINWLFVLSVLIGLCVKETIVICIPFYFFYQYNYNKNKTIIVTFLTCLLVTILFLIIKNYAPVTNIISKNNFWIFNLKNAEINFTRFNTWGSFIFSFGIVGLLFINNLLKFNIKNMLANKLILACLASIVSAYFLYVLSYFSTIADGRIIWLTYFYMLLIVNGLPNKDK